VAKHREMDEAFENAELATLEAIYSPEYLRSCASPDAREERIQELKRRIQARAYQIDADRIAEELLLRGDLD
jgi:anti-sigma28 factor (negative regulator of flagellin synthesis)